MGFEPTVGLTPHIISSDAPSAARTRHRRRDYRTSHAALNRPLPGEERVQQGGRLGGQYTGDDLGPVVESPVAHHVPQRPRGAGLVVVRTEDDAVDPRLRDEQEDARAQAYRAEQERLRDQAQRAQEDWQRNGDRSRVWTARNGGRR